MDRKLLFLAVALTLAASALAGSTMSLKMCTNSNDCGQGECCRDENGNTITSQQGIWGVIGGRQGVCTSGAAKSGETCDFNCGCGEGLTCYQPMSGVCCPPRRCYDTEYVLAQQAYWANCRPPTCFFPPR